MEMFCLSAVIAFPIALGIMLVFHCMILHKIAFLKRHLNELEGKKGWGCGPCGGWRKWKGKCGQKKSAPVPAPANLETQSTTSMSINSETPVVAFAPCEDKDDVPVNPVNNRGVTIHIQPHNGINANSNDMK